MTLEARFRLDLDAFVLDVDFRVPARGVTALFGPSGSGKTLTLRAMAGLEQVPGGIVRVGDEVWQDAEIFVPTHERGVGFVFQEASLFAHLTVEQNLEYARKRVPAGRPVMALEDAASFLGVTSLLARKPHGLSGGERQRVAVARALLGSPTLLLMDEPLASLDQAGKDEILPFLERLHDESNVPCVYVSHATDEVAQLADHMVLLDRGRVRATGTISDMLTRLDLPPALGRDAEAVIEATVLEQESESGLTRLRFQGGEILIPELNLSLGRTVRVRLRASDVSLTLERHSDTSILNIFPATVSEISPGDGARLTVRLDVGGVPILARVTRHSASRLELAPGRRVYAQVKSVALMAASP